jgi:hypothetical protein
VKQINECAAFIFSIGLLDADDPEDFHTKLASVKNVWDSKEQEYLPIGKSPKFHDYILNKVSVH